MFGDSALPSRPSRPWVYHFVDALNDVVLVALIASAIVLLCFGAVYSKNTGDVMQGAGILCAALIVAGITSVQSLNQEKELNYVAELKSDRDLVVVRDGRESIIHASDLVVGDIAMLRPGEVITADGVFLTGHGIKCDESAATAESFLVPKGQDNLFFIGGSKIMVGSGSMLVLSVGMNSTYGKIREVMDDMDPPPSPLADKLDRIGTRIGYFALSAGVSIFLILTIAYLILMYPLYNGAFRAILNFFIMGVTIIVVAVPEGLPLALTLTQLNTLKHLRKVSKVLVKDVATCELLGDVTAITVDKVGTLTAGRPIVARGWFFGNLYDSVPDLGKTVGPARRDLLARVCALNSDASISYTPDALRVFRTSKPGGVTATGGPASVAAAEAACIEAMEDCAVTGSTTDVALLHMLRMDLDMDFSGVRRGAGPFVYRDAFTSTKGRSLTIFSPNSPGSSIALLKTISEAAQTMGGGNTSTLQALPGGGRYTVYVTGAPELVVASCAVYMTADGNLIPLEARRRETLASVVELLAGRGLRPLAIAYRTLDPSLAPQGAEAGGERAAKAWEASLSTVESGLILLAVVGMRDPVRPGVAERVAACASGGIKVRLATGEHLACAKALAEEMGILKDGTVLDGATWRTMSPDERSAVIPRLEVLARATPNDKLMLCEALKELGEVVMATGEGTEDAGTVAAAAIGVASGRFAVEVAREVSKIVSVTGDFNGLVDAVQWGRAILENVRKFMQFQLTINIVVVITTLVSAFLHMGQDTPFPFASIQLLWINLIMDALGALMLATEAADPEIMRVRPGDKSIPLLTPTILKNIALQGALQLGIVHFLAYSAVGASLFSIPVATMGTLQHFTCVFNTFVFLQVFNYFNTRRIHDQANLIHGLRSNLYGLGILAGIVVAQLIIILVGNYVFQTFSVSIAQLLVSIALGLVALVGGLVARLIPPKDVDFHGGGGASGGRGGGGTLGRTGSGWGRGTAKVAPTPYKPWLERSGKGGVSPGRTAASGSRSMGGGGDEESETMRLTGSLSSSTASEPMSNSGRSAMGRSKSPRVVPFSGRR